MSHVNYCYSAASEPGGNAPFFFFNYYFFSPTPRRTKIQVSCYPTPPSPYPKSPPASPSPRCFCALFWADRGLEHRGRHGTKQVTRSISAEPVSPRERFLAPKRAKLVLARVAANTGRGQTGKERPQPTGCAGTLGFSSKAGGGDGNPKLGCLGCSASPCAGGSRCWELSRGCLGSGFGSRGTELGVVPPHPGQCGEGTRHPGTWVCPHAGMERSRPRPCSMRSNAGSTQRGGRRNGKREEEEIQLALCPRCARGLKPRAGDPSARPQSSHGSAVPRRDLDLTPPVRPACSEQHTVTPRPPASCPQALFSPAQSLPIHPKASLLCSSQPQSGTVPAPSPLCKAREHRARRRQAQLRKSAIKLEPDSVSFSI